MTNKVKNRIIQLRKDLSEYNYQYYVQNQSLISDYDFDVLLKELEDLENSYPEFSDENSPTKRVGGDITKNFPSIKTPISNAFS